MDDTKDAKSEKPAAKKPQAAEPSAPARVTRWRILAPKVLNMRGVVVSLAVGDVVSEDGHGPDMVQALITAGTFMEPAK